MSLRHRLSLALGLVHLVASATLIRSILYDRWFTVLTSTLLIAGVVAARRGKTWGIGVTLAAAAAFPMARVLGMAPSWFWLVGAIGALPFALTSPSMARFDAKATKFGAALAVTAGLLGAIGWRAFGPALVGVFPALRPGFWPAHGGVATLTAVTLALFAWASQRAAARSVPPDSDANSLSFTPSLTPREAASRGVRVLEASPLPVALDPGPLYDEQADDALAPPSARGRRA